MDRSKIDFQLKEPSIGGDVNDLLGVLKKIQKPDYLHTTLNPHGNPFENKSTKEMFDCFKQLHPDGLPSLLNGLNQVFDDKESIPQDVKDVERMIKKELDNKT